jgi:hypothetical protein
MLTGSQKAERVLKLLLGLRNIRIASALAAHGFKKEDLDEGWSLLRGLARIQLDALPATLTADPSLLGLLDDWENRWFPIVDATLARNFPEVHEKVFLNLAQETGQAVIVTVGTFLDRFDALDQDSAGPRSKDARALLARRGLSPAVLDAARRVLEQLGSIESVEPLAEPEESAAHFEQAEAALWAWYLEWSRVARVAIRDRRSLRALGFLTRAASGASDEADEPGDLAMPAAVPAASPAAGPNGAAAGAARAADIAEP